MPQNVRSLPGIIPALLVLGTLAGLFAASKRLHIESINRRIEIGIEWNEVSQLAQISGKPIAELLAAFKNEGVSTLIISEDTIGSLEQNGELQPQKTSMPDGKVANSVLVRTESALRRIQSALTDRGFPINVESAGSINASTFFYQSTGDSNLPRTGFYVPVDFANIRNTGLGLAPEAQKASAEAQLRIAGRISNFAGVNVISASNVLHSLKNQGASTIIFNGDEALGYRGIEKSVADLLRSKQRTITDQDAPPLVPTGLVFGEVEFGKQKGDEKISAALHGDYVRVHSIQTAEMGTLDEIDIVDRFVRAVKERNIRFCYVRMLTQSGSNPIAANLEFFHKIKKGMEKGSLNTGGGLHFGAAHLFQDTGIPKIVFLVAGLSTGAAVVWMVTLLIPMTTSNTNISAVISALIFGIAAYAGGETGRKIAALAAGIVFPTAACLITLPGVRFRKSTIMRTGGCVRYAVKAILLATAITAAGIFHVIALLSTEPFMVVANQFLGIKLQHALPIFIVVYAVLVGSSTVPNETWLQYKARCRESLKSVFNEPARYGTMIIGLLAIALLALVVARSGNDPGTGVSGFEMKTRSILDHIFPVRPRTKELLGGHPAFILAIAWWWRGRKNLAIPLFIFGCLGQVSLLNTFCHIHTPLIISVWHGSLGLLLGSLLGIALFLILERILPRPELMKDTSV